MLLSILIPSIVTAATPPAAGSIGALIFLRVVTGLAEAASYPAIHTLAAQWSPIHERSSFICTVWSGAYICTAVTLPVTGYLVTAYGWPVSFYAFGALGIVWSLAWLLLGASSPELHGCLTTNAERDYIVSQRGVPAAARAAVPWCKLLSNRAVYAVVIAHTCHNWCVPCTFLSPLFALRSLS